MNIHILVFLVTTVFFGLMGCSHAIDHDHMTRIEASPACNGTADESALCIEQKVLSWRTALALPGHDSTFQVFEASCKADDPDGCWMLGRALQGNGQMAEAMMSVQSYRENKINPELGAAFMKKSCDLGSDHGCLFHASDVAERANWNPEAMEPLGVEAVMKVFYNACEQGFLTGCGGYFDLSLKFDPTIDVEKEKFSAQAVCNANIGIGCHIFALYLTQDATNEDEHQLALPFWRKGCQAAHEDSCRAYAGNMSYFDNPTDFDWAISTACANGFNTKAWSEIDTVEYPPCPSTNTSD